MVVPDEATATNLAKSLSDGIKHAHILLVGDSKGVHKPWGDICRFVQRSKSNFEVIEPLNIAQRMEDVVLILFTSGTTSMRKVSLPFFSATADI